MARAANKETGEVEVASSSEVVSDPHAWVNKEAKGLDFTPTTWEELEAAFEDEGGLIEFEGSPWAVIDKAKLVDVPFIIADVREYTSGKFGNDVMAVMVVTKDAITIDGKPRTQFVFNDGSTGVMEQIKGVVATTGRKAGFKCPNGLRRSDYKVMQHDPFGNEPDKEIESTTYYIS